MGAEQSTLPRKPVPVEVNVDLRTFHLLRVVGKGAFGKVRIVEKKDSGVLYALKYINKLQCIRMRAIQNIFRERCILEDINHPLIVNLRYAFQDDYHMFMVLDLMEGGDLRFHLDKHGGFPEHIIRAWAAEIVFGIIYLHSKNVLHRDLKPDNVLLDAAGHAHLTDFNIAVNFGDRRMLKSHSGTLAYMAPDILLDKGYLWQIDWWSAGVILYELFYGKRPFRAASNAELGRAIKAGAFVFHSHNQVTKQPCPISSEFRSLLSGLMTVDRDARLGCGPAGTREVMAHPWFRGIDWAAVGEKRMTPLYIPDSQKANFDMNLEEDEQKQDDEYLQYRPKLRQNKTALANELKAAASVVQPVIPVPSPSRSGAPPSLAKFLNATPILSTASTPPTSQVSYLPTNNNNNNGSEQSNSTLQRTSTAGAGRIMEVTQLLGLQQIRDSVENNAIKDPKAANRERIEAELDFIDENYDPFDWEVAARVVAREAADRAREAEAGAERVGRGSLPRLGSLGRARSGAALDAAEKSGKTAVRTLTGSRMPGTGSMGRSKSIGTLNRTVQQQTQQLLQQPTAGSSAPVYPSRPRRPSASGAGTVPRGLGGGSQSPLVPRRRE